MSVGTGNGDGGEFALEVELKNRFSKGESFIEYYLTIGSELEIRQFSSFNRFVYTDDSAHYGWRIILEASR